jgi:hypothetical protein
MGVRGERLKASSCSELSPSDEFFSDRAVLEGGFEHREAASPVQKVQIEGSRQAAEAVGNRQ